MCRVTGKAGSQDVGWLIRLLRYEHTLELNRTEFRRPCSQDSENRGGKKRKNLGGSGSDLSVIAQ